jgi:hypothetical protein
MELVTAGILAVVYLFDKVDPTVARIAGCPQPWNGLRGYTDVCRPRCLNPLLRQRMNFLPER